MTAISNYAEEKLLNLTFRDTTFTTPGTSVYCSLHNADPSETGASELSGGSYARAQAISWNAPSNRAITNSAAIVFPTLTATISSATHMGFWDASTSGNFLWGTPTDKSFLLAMTSGSIPTFNAGTVSITARGGLSSYLSHKWLNHVFRNTAFTTPGTSLYASLHTSTPGLAGSNEISGNGYARVQVSTNWVAPTNGVTTNSTEFTFDTPTGNQGTATHYGIWDALTTGNFLYGDDMATEVEILSGVAQIISIDGMTITVA